MKFTAAVCWIAEHPRFLSRRQKRYLDARECYISPTIGTLSFALLPKSSHTFVFSTNHRANDPFSSAWKKGLAGLVLLLCCNSRANPKDVTQKFIAIFGQHSLWCLNKITYRSVIFSPLSLFVSSFCRRVCPVSPAVVCGIVFFSCTIFLFLEPGGENRFCYRSEGENVRPHRVRFSPRRSSTR